MNILIHETEGQKIAEVIADEIVIHKTQDALDLIVNPAAMRANKFIIHKANLHPDFFVLSTRLAGEILQKYVNYHIQIAIVGDFEEIESESLRAFITECNRGRDVFFVKDTESAIQALK